MQNVADRASASTGAGGADARNVADRASASIGDGGTDARSVADRASATTDAEGADAKIAMQRLRQRLGLPAWRRWMRRDAKLEWQLHRQ